MSSKFAAILTLALVITGVGIALQKGSPVVDVVKAFFDGFSSMQTAAYGPTNANMRGTSYV